MIGTKWGRGSLGGDIVTVVDDNYSKLLILIIKTAGFAEIYTLPSGLTAGREEKEGGGGRSMEGEVRKAAL